MRKREIIVVGGGASGMMAAIAAAREGANVTVVEQKDRVGKKILSTGNGRCNLTNEYMDTSCFRGDDTSIVSKVLDQFGVIETRSFFEGLGLIMKDRQGYVYPLSEQASTVLDLLRMEMKHLNITLCLDEKVHSISKNKKGFCVQTNKQALLGNSVILATGGKAAPVLGSDGSGYTLAKQCGHQLSPVVPALVQLICEGDWFSQVSGVRTQAKVSLYVDEQLVCQDKGELQLTNYGLSGIPVFQVSRFAAKGLYKKKKVATEIDFIPSMTEEEFRQYFDNRLAEHNYKTAEDFLVGMFHKKICVMLLKQADIPLHGIVEQIPEKKLQKLCELCKHFKITVVKTNSFDAAQVCAGGVKTSEINAETMESLYMDGLYLTGELLDIDGICGGYNLQWAWSTGYIAGKHAAKGR